MLYKLTNKNADGSIKEIFNYTYDAANNQTSKEDNKGTTEYTYDDLNRLESVEEPEGKVTEYTFDAAGNRATQTVASAVYEDVYSNEISIYTYDQLNRLISILKTIDGQTAGTTEYTYDNNGNQLTVTEAVYGDEGLNDPIVTFNGYDKLNQLIRTQTPKGKVIANKYNGEGKRVAKEVDGNETKYLYEGDKVILELDGDNHEKARNVQGTSLISRTTGDTTAYYMFNGHGDVTSVQEAVYDNELASYYYDAFGNPETVQESVYGDVYGSEFNNPFRYAIKEFDEETGTYYLMARMYDPETGRFLSEDTYRGNTSEPLSLNLYTYCKNEPIMYWDYDGHDPMGLNAKISDKLIKEAYEKYNSNKNNIKPKVKTQLSMASKKYWEEDDSTNILPKSVLNIKVSSSINTKAKKDKQFNIMFDEQGRIITVGRSIELQKEYEKKLVEDVTTDWKTEGKIYGLKKSAMNFITLGQSDKNPLTKVAPKKTPLSEKSKFEYGLGTLEGSVAFEGITAYATIGIGEIANLATKTARGATLIDDAVASGKGLASERTVSTANSNLPVLYDGDFAAQQILKSPTNITSGGRTITAHAAERMVTPPAGRVPTTMQEIDDFLDTATSVRKISQHPLGDTITLRKSNSSIKEVVVDAATGNKVITVINPKK